MSSYTLRQLHWTTFPSCTLGSKLETKQVLSIRSLCYQSQVNIPGELCFLNREKEQIQSCISLLLITKFIYLIKFSLTLILTTYKNLFSKFLFHKPFIIFQIQTNLSCISSSKNKKTVGKNYHFSSTKISSLPQQHISYLFYTQKSFPYYFYISQFLLLEALMKLSESNIIPAFFDWQTQEHTLQPLKTYMIFIA